MHTEHLNNSELLNTKQQVTVTNEPFRKSMKHFTNSNTYSNMSFNKMLRGSVLWRNYNNSYIAYSWENQHMV